MSELQAWQNARAEEFNRFIKALRAAREHYLEAAAEYRRVWKASVLALTTIENILSEPDLDPTSRVMFSWQQTTLKDWMEGGE